jgi:glycosyltransferase involved in cell wall biosynthesis
MRHNTVLIIPFSLPWDRAADYQRQTCLELAKHHRVIAYMQRDSVFFLKAIVSSVSYPKYKHIRFYRPIYLLPFRRVPEIEKINHLMSYCLFVWGQSFLCNTVLWIFDPVFYMLPRFFRTPSIYDCVDFHAGFFTGEKRKIIEKYERALIQEVTFFFVNSTVLYTKHKKTRAADAVVPQGFRLDEFRKKHPSGMRLPTDKPIVGYIGSIDDRIDLPLLKRIISKNPQWLFVLWGPLQMAALKEKIEILNRLIELEQYPNVLTGYSSADTIFSLVKQFDIGMIPYRSNLASVRYSYPMKLFEYFYAGKPVISSYIEELRGYPYIQFGKTPQEWELLLRQTVSRNWPKQYQRKQQALAIQNSWENKINTILSYL